MPLDLEAGAEIEAKEDAGVEVAIIDPRTGEVAAHWRVAGTYSAKYRREWDALTKRLIAERRAGKASDEEKDEEEYKLIAACSIAPCWREGEFMDKGVPLTFSKANAVTILRRLPFVFEQVRAAMRDHERFFANGSPNSSSTPSTSAD